MSTTQHHRVEHISPGTSLVDYCKNAFPLLGSKTAVKKAIATGRLLVNGEVAQFSTSLREGDSLELTGSGVSKARSFEKKLPVVFEDDHLLVINKPAGIAVNGNRIKTVENAVAGTEKPSSQPDALPRPVAVHRIDLPTKGLVVLAKTKEALIRMGKAFEENEVRKEYTAVVHGQPEEKGHIDQAIQGKPAVTEYRTVRTVPSRVYKHLALVKLHPITGRTHQLRIHMRQAGHLILGDKQYAAGQKTILGKGLFLCATQLSFLHPVTEKPVVLRVNPPRRFDKTLDREEERY